MADHFSLLNEARRPWLDVEELKEKFHAFSARHHPDVAGVDSPDFLLLNAAFNTLREPRSRLRHLLELECPDELNRVRQIPSELADLFMQIGALRQRFEAFLKKQSVTVSSLAQALLAPEKMSLRETVEAQLATVNERQAKLLGELRALDTRWPAEKPFAQLAGIAHALSFVAKWSEQLREDVVKLGL